MRWPTKIGGYPFHPSYRAIPFKVAQHTNKLSSKPATEEQFHSLTLPLSRQRTNWSKNLRADQDLEPTLIDPVFSVAASSNTPVTYAQLHLRFATVVTKVINSQAIRIASPSLAPPHTGVPTTAPPSDKGHFVLPLLEDPDSKCRAQIPFPIDLAASCNTLLSCHLSSMPWAKILQSKTVILPYASPPIKPISQVTLQASKGKSTSNLTLQVINNDQPALLSTEASIALGNILPATLPSHCGLNLPATMNQKLGHFHHPQILALDAYEATGQLKRVSQRTDWISNTVVLEREPTPTKPGITRISLNPSQTLDKAIRCSKYLHKLHGMQYMSVIDIQEAFQNIPLSLRSSLMTTTFRPWGYYPLHPKNGSAEFIWYWPPRHQCCDEILIPGCVANNTEARIDHERNLINPIILHNSSALDKSSRRPTAYSRRPNHYRAALCATRKRAPGYRRSLQKNSGNGFWENPTQSPYRPPTTSANLQEGPRSSPKQL
ncbi:hypothetical protein pdam_00021349 [Pocillopora damicornis]|uniref:Reverse transcriptase domain-containing protein n=1 Tax=Pocillopora damicornis TaxID=46731 RepID=A0A3M6UNR4_POCDA|nr:hypothetical protein pdam_00021349 [Pocillopora damicornis]